MQARPHISIFTSTDGTVFLEVNLSEDTVWLNRKQLSLLFDRDIKTIGKHIGNVFKEKELEEQSTVAKFATVQTEGVRKVKRLVEHYNLFKQLAF